MNRYAATLAGLSLRRTCARSRVLGSPARHAGTAMELSKPVAGGGPGGGLTSRTYR